MQFLRAPARRNILSSISVAAPLGAVSRYDSGVIYAITGTAVAAAGVACLYGSWQDRIAARWRPVAVGWALLLASTWAWTHATGAEFGISLTLLLPTVLAWVLIARNAEVRSPKATSRRPRRKADADLEPKAAADRRTLLAHLRLFIVSVPLAAIAATYVTIALCSLLPLTQVNQLVLALFVIPLVWGSAAYWAVADSRWLRPSLAMLVGGGIAAVLVHL
jgi:hypothetical protein